MPRRQSQLLRRPFTRQELQAFFDRADDEVDRIAALGRKGWLPAYRDAVLFKVAYCWGLRRNEVRHLQTVDLARNPHAREFGKCGVLQVRYGKAMKGSPPKRGSGLTVFDWSAEIIADWLERGHRHMTDGLDLFPSERGTLVSETALNRRFNRYCEDLGLSPGLDIHSLRRSYVTHLIEAGMDPLFVQHQAGHEHNSTTALYTSVTRYSHAKVGEQQQVVMVLRLEELHRRECKVCMLSGAPCCGASPTAAWSSRVEDLVLARSSMASSGRAVLQVSQSGFTE